jgi:predicted nucleic acid-binding protein
MIVLDASVLISYQDVENTNHRRAADLIAGTAGQYLFVPAVTWAEVLVGAIKAGEIEEAIDGVLRQLGVAVANADGPEWPLELAEVRARTGLKMPDAIVLATAESLKAKVATFDNKLREVAANEGRLYEPPAE